MRFRRRKRRLFYGWYVLAASFIVLFLSRGSRFALGVMVKPMEADLGWSRGAISSAVFVNLVVYALSTFITGSLYDRYGPKWIIVGSTLCFSAGHALLATCELSLAAVPLLRGAQRSGSGRGDGDPLRLADR